jgi:hypothetical protein
MSLDLIIDKLLLSTKKELDKEKNIIFIENEILKPLIYKIMSNLYPYFMGFTIMILCMFVFIMVIFVLNIKILFK